MFTFGLPLYILGVGYLLAIILPIGLCLYNLCDKPPKADTQDLDQLEGGEKEKLSRKKKSQDRIKAAKTKKAKESVVHIEGKFGLT